MKELLESKGFTKKDNKYGTGDEYMNGDLYSHNTIGIHINGDNVSITKYHFEGEYSRNNSHGIFSGKINNEDEMKMILKMIGV